MLAIFASPPTDPLVDYPLARDRGLWRSSLAIGLGFVALTMVYSLWLAGLIFGVHAWFVPQDVWQAVDAGRYVWTGALGYVYQGSGSYSLPLGFIVISPVVGLCDHLHLVEGAPAPLAYPSAWLLIGPYTLLFGVFLLHAVRRLAWDLGLRQQLWALQLLSVAIVLVPAAEWGHFEDVIALTMVLHAARRLVAHDPLRAALYLSIGVASKQWAMLLIPFVVLSAPAGRRLRSLLFATALPGALLLFLLGVDWRDASRALFSPDNLGRGATQGHIAFFGTWLGSKTSRASRTLAMLLAPVVGWKARGVRYAPAVLATMSGILLIRPLMEAINFSYYWSPGLLLAGLAGVAAHGRVRWQDWTAPVLATAWATPRGGSGPLWWSGELALLLVVACEIGMACRWPSHRWSRKVVSLWATR